MRFALAVCLFGCCVNGAQADVTDYCAAYARDFADEVGQQSAQWQHRYDNAEKSCLFRFTSEAAPVLKPASKPKPKARLLVASKQAAKAKSDVTEPAAEPPKQKPQLAEGSPEWIAYCKKKYVSFDEAKGTYQSKTGVERKCLLTAD